MEIGKIYTLTVDSIIEMPDGRKYIYFEQRVNGRQVRVKALDFLAQPDASLPATIDVYVKDIEPMHGMPILQFSRNWLIDTLYGDEKLPKKFSFNVFAIRWKGLFLKDSYGATHYFPFYGNDSMDNYSEGDQITLFVDEVATYPDGNKYLKLRKPERGNQINQYIRAFTTRDIVDDEKPLRRNVDGGFSYGEESNIVEFKQSLVYHPDYSDVQLDRQIFNIMRSISGFMNKDGGTLYVGVKDDGSVCGIHNDLPHLSEDSGYSYPANWDGWSRKVVDSVRKYLGKYAANLIDIEKCEHGDKVVAKITIRKSTKPIYVNNEMLFCRQCNSTGQLKGDTLTLFIMERLQGDALGEMFDNKFGYDTEVADVEVDTEYEPAEGDTITHVAVEEERNQNNWLYLRLFADGKYILTERNATPALHGADVVCDYQLKQYHKNENQVLLLIYNDVFKVNTIDFSEGKSNWFNEQSLTNRRENAPWRNNNQVSIKCVDRNDLLVAFYVSGGEEYCHVEDVSAIKPSQSDRSKALFTEGHLMALRNAELKGKIMHIPGSYRNAIAPIVNKQCSVSDPKKRKTIQRLVDILNELYPNYGNE